MDHPSVRMLHVASQYLAAAAVNYLEKKDDDSHTNLGWGPETFSFSTRTFATNQQLFLLTRTMELEWRGKNTMTFSLDGKMHGDVIAWLDLMSKMNGHSGYAFDLHYELDSGPINDAFEFSRLDPEKVDRSAMLRTMCQTACERVLERFVLNSEIRVWPHHFDTGAFINLPNGIDVGFGMAIPDPMVDDHYLYCSGYKGHDGVDPSGFPTLSKGEWRSNGWKGGLLPTTEVDQNAMDLFFIEAIHAFVGEKAE